MAQKYSFPTHIFLSFEKVHTFAYTSSSLLPNSYILLINNCWLYSLSTYIKREVNLHDSFLVESSAFYNNKSINSYNLNSYILSKLYFYNYYLFYFYTIKVKLFLLVYNLKNNLEFNSLDSIILNANWLERETSEMYGIFFRSKKDTRKLLLDYSRSEYPLRKDFSSEGYVDFFYSVFENDVVYLNNDVVEL